MDIARLKEISLAEGRVEGFIENSIKDVSDENQQLAQQLLVAWKTVASGLDELRKENFELATKLERAKVLLGEYQLASD
jgi:hypothetical protein